MYPNIEDQDASQIARAFIEVVTRVGQLGKDASQAIDAALKDVDRDPDVEEGLAQLSDFF